MNERKPGDWCLTPVHPRGLVRVVSVEQHEQWPACGRKVAVVQTHDGNGGYPAGSKVRYYADELVVVCGVELDAWMVAADHSCASREAKGVAKAFMSITERIRQLGRDNPDSLASWPQDGFTSYRTVEDWAAFVLDEAEQIAEI